AERKLETKLLTSITHEIVRMIRREYYHCDISLPSNASGGEIPEPRLMIRHQFEPAVTLLSYAFYQSYIEGIQVAQPFEQQITTCFPQSLQLYIHVWGTVRTDVLRSIAEIEFLE